MKERHIVAFGTDCLLPLQLRTMGLHKESMPLDWCRYMGNKKTVLEENINITCNNFLDLFNKEYIEVRDPTNEVDHGILLYNTKLDFRFKHELFEGQDFDTEYPKILEKYNRRIKRFLNALNSTEEVIIVHMSYEPMVLTEKIVLNCYKKLKKAFPKSNIKFLIFANNPTMNQFEYEIKKPNKKITYITMNNSEYTSVREDHFLRNECIYMKLLYDYFYPKPTKWQRFKNYYKSKKMKREIRLLHDHFFHEAFSLKNLFKTNDK